MMNSKLEQNEGQDVTVANDFREVGILKDPFNFNTTTVSTQSTARMTTAVIIPSAPSNPYEIDEKITQSTTGAVGRVVEWDATNNILYFVQERFVDYGIHANGNAVGFKFGGNVITGAISNETATPLTTAGTVNNINFNSSATGGRGYNDPELEPNSGHILYVENRRIRFLVRLTKQKILKS